MESKTASQIEAAPSSAGVTMPGQHLLASRFRSGAAVVVTLTFVVRVAVAYGREWVGYDEANYLMIARHAKAGLGFTQSTLEAYAPKFHLLSFLVPRALLELFADELFVAKLIFVVTGTVAAVLVTVLGRLLFGPAVGLVAGALFAVASSATTLLSHSISHNLFLPFFFAGLVALWLAVERDSVAWALLAGAMVGLGWWARADGLLLAPLAVVFAVAAGWLLRSLRSGARLGAAVAGAFCVPYLIYGRVVSSISAGRSEAHGPLFDFLQYPLPCVPKRDLQTYDSLFALFLGEPRCVLERVIENAGTIPDLLLAWSAFPIVLLPLVGAAWMAERRLEPRSLAAHALLLIAILPLLGYLPFYYEESRYVGPYAPIGFIWCALGVLGLGARLAEALSRSDGRSRMRGPAPSAACWAPAVGLWLLMATITALHGRRMDEVASMEYVEAGRWIDEHSEEGVTLWTTQSQIAFEAHRGWTYPPAPERLADPRGGRVLLAYDTRNFLAKRPEWRALLEPPSERWLRPLYTTQLPGPTVTIYEVQPPAAQGESR